MRDKQTDNMWAVALIFIAVVNCNGEVYRLNTAALPEAEAGDDRIIGGSKTYIEKYPFTVQILRISEFHCGGSLLTTGHVLTAAHCFIDSKNPSYTLRPDQYSIREGTTYLSNGGTLHPVKAIKVHERYNIPIRDNDVAVVLMTTPVDHTVSVARVASIPHQDAVVPRNALVTAVGWGQTTEDDTSASEVLNEVTVRKIDLSICRDRYLRLQEKIGYPYPVTNNMICAGILDVGIKDACQGDSGGPLIYKGVVVGITSWGVGCARPEYPGVSARVASFTTWIQKAVQNGSKKVSNGITGSLSSKIWFATLLVCCTSV